jgi:tetratricopeptide (TPR) repeat protein
MRRRSSSTRVGICDSLRRGPLEAVRKEEPRYAEGAYFLARLDIARANETGAPAARALLTEAYGRFPKSPAVTYLAGNYNQLIGDCKEALKYYDETVAIEPLHDNALLGRTICLAFLKRFDESIASATRMIAIPSANLADAYYWRAVGSPLPEGSRAGARRHRSGEDDPRQQQHPQAGRHHRARPGRSREMPTRTSRPPSPCPTASTTVSRAGIWVSTT